MTKDELKNQASEIVKRAMSESRELTEEERSEVERIKSDIRAMEDNKPEDDQPEDNKPEEEASDNNEEPAPEDNTDENAEDGNKDNKNNRNNNIINSKMEKRFNLLKELRNAYESGKKFEMSENRAYTVAAEGEDVVVTDVFDIWEPLRGKNVLVQAGAQTILGVKNNIQIPIMGAVSCSFAGETDSATDGSGAFTQKKLSPKRITAKYPISLQLLAQDSIGVENKIRADIQRAVAAKLEETLLGDAAGDDDKPAGLFYGKDLTALTSFGAVTAFEAGVEEANVTGECKYIMSPKAKADFRNMAKSAKSTQLVMENGAIDGTEAFSTTHVGNKNVVYGDFSNLVIATWDQVEFDVVRDVASVGNGVVTIVVNAFVDAALVRPNALVYGTTQA